MIDRVRVRQLVEDIFDAFQNPGGCDCIPEGRQMYIVIDELAPYLKHFGKNDEDTQRALDLVKVSFGLGYTTGQMFDIPGLDIGPVRDLLKKKGAFVYVPRDKKAA